MKALFLVFHGFSEFNGISKKIHYQIDALRKCKVDAHLCYLRFEKDKSHTRMVDDFVVEKYNSSILGKIRKRIAYTSLFNYIKDNHFDLIYIRYANNANPFLNRFVKKLKLSNLKIVMEIPTYPYDDEYKDSPLKDKLRLFIDKRYRMTLAKSLDYIVSYTNLKTIFDCPVINISNGVDFDKIPLKENINDTSSILRLIGVAEIHYWHGFDRVIKGLINYYRQKDIKKEVFFDIVGYGADSTLNELKKLVKDNNLEKQIVFHGPKFGDELNELFEKADFAIASLGRHRSGIYDIKTLKNREYAARGLAFMYSENDSDFDNMSYVLQSEPSESAIDINKVISFYNNIKNTPIEIRETIKSLSWENQMNKIIQTIES